MSAAEHYNAQVLKERLELHPEKHPSQWGTRARERNNIDKKADPLPVQDSTDGNIDKQAGPLPVQASTDGNIDKQAGPLPVANRLREASEVLEAGKAGDEHDSDLFDVFPAGRAIPRFCKSKGAVSRRLWAIRGRGAYHTRARPRGRPAPEECRSVGG